MGSNIAHATGNFAVWIKKLYDMTALDFNITRNDFTVNAGDEIFATAMQLGRTIYNAAFTGIRSVNDLLMALTRELAGFSGIITVNLRNRTQGTTSKRVLRVAGPRRFMLSQAV